MNLREAVTGSVREYVADVANENWTDTRLLEAMGYAIKHMRNQLHKTKRDWFTDLVRVSSDDMGTFEGFSAWELPAYVERVTGVFTDDDLECIIPYRQAKSRSFAGTTWMMLPGHRRRMGLTRSIGCDVIIQYLPRVPALHWGNVTVIGASTLTLTPLAGRLSMFAGGYRGWPLEITQPDSVAAGQMYQPEASLYNPAVIPTLTVTMDTPLVAPIPVEDDEYSLWLPWDGRLDEPLCMLCAYRVLVSEGHRRQAQELQGMLSAAMGDIDDAGIFDGDDTGTMVEEVN